MNMMTTNIHYVESCEVRPVVELKSSDGHEYEHQPYIQKIVINTDDGSEHTFTMFFSDAVCDRLQREANSASTVVGALR